MHQAWFTATLINYSALLSNLLDIARLGYKLLWHING
jgi:hypothetical protein